MKVSNVMSLDQRGLSWHGISGFLSSYNNLDLQIEVKQAIRRNKKTSTTTKHKGRRARVFKRARNLHHVKALLLKLRLHWTERWRKTDRERLCSPERTHTHNRKVSLLKRSAPHYLYFRPKQESFPPYVFQDVPGSNIHPSRMPETN